jgi:hypothetical protein
VPAIFTTLLPIATFLLGVLFPSPTSMPLINKQQHTVEEQERIVALRDRTNNPQNVEPTSTEVPAVPVTGAPASGGPVPAPASGPTVNQVV